MMRRSTNSPPTMKAVKMRPLAFVLLRACSEACLMEAFRINRGGLWKTLSIYPLKLCARRILLEESPTL